MRQKHTCTHAGKVVALLDVTLLDAPWMEECIKCFLNPITAKILGYAKLRSIAIPLV